MASAAGRAHLLGIGDQASLPASPDRQGDRTMLNKSKVAFALALVLGTASIAMAAPRHTVHRHVPAAAYQTYGQAGAPRDYGFAVEHGKVKKILGETGGVLIQDRDFAQSNGVAPENIW
jgi:hypothetical protein